MDPPNAAESALGRGVRREDSLCEFVIPIASRVEGLLGSWMSSANSFGSDAMETPSQTFGASDNVSVTPRELSIDNTKGTAY